MAVVTGASRGIGRATAARFAAAGACVVMTGRDQKAGEAAASAIQGEGGRAIFVQADQGQDDDWSRTIAAAEDAFDGVDILVVNAGVSAMARTAELSLADFRAMNRTNLKGPFLGVKHATTAMRRRGGGSIVLVASIAGRIGVADHIHYTASKGGVRLLAKAAALELGPEKIRVNSVHPGFTRTEMTARFPEALVMSAPLQRFGEPRDLAEAVLFLASDRSIFMTGAELVVDGGWTVQ